MFWNGRHSDGGFVGQGKRSGSFGGDSCRGCRSSIAAQLYAPDSYRLGDVFKRLRPHVLERGIDLAANLIVSG